MPPSAKQFVDTAAALIAEVVDRNGEAIDRAADLLYAALRDDGVIQAFGTGHSVAAALEIAGRAGGLVPTNRISLTDLVVHGRQDPAVLDDPLLERSPAVAAQLLALAGPSPVDAFVVLSNSGVNASVVDMAMLVKENELPLVAITSVAGSTAVPSRHPTGTRLLDHADVVLDNAAPPGDTLLDAGETGRVCAVSSITTALLVQMLVAEIIRRYLDAGATPPVYRSANVPGGHEHNVALEARYAGRIRRGGF